MRALPPRLAPLAPLALLAVRVGAQGPAPAAPAAAADVVPPTIDACYVPASGTIYRIDTQGSPAPGTPKACLAATHVKFTWNQQGPAGPKGDKGDPGSPASLGPDVDLPGTLKMGKTGTFGGGLLATGATPLAIPSGDGTRLMWIPQKSAFRAGQVAGTQWDEANVGSGSLAAGADNVASGAQSVALGRSSSATADFAIAAGDRTAASAPRAVALGALVTASGNGSVALGGRASTNGMAGAFVYGDQSTNSTVQADAENQFLVRAAGGVKLRTAGDLSKGCNVDREGNLTCTGTVTGTNTAPALGPDLTLPGALSMGKTGTFGGGLLATNATSLAMPRGSGFRFMWIPQEAAIRAGGTEDDAWDEANIGQFSAAFGLSTRATQTGATAIGLRTTASHFGAFAGGNGSVASGVGSLAFGGNVKANGEYSVVLGRHASANGNDASFVFGDGSSETDVQASAPNQFVVRASGGVRLRTSSDLAAGCDVDGSGRIGCSGGVDRARTVVRLTSPWSNIGKGQTEKATYSCPSGSFIIGGGVETDDFEQNESVPVGVTASYPRYDDNRWVVTLNAATNHGSAYRIYVVCMRGS